MATSPHLCTWLLPTNLPLQDQEKCQNGTLNVPLSRTFTRFSTTQHPQHKTHQKVIRLKKPIPKSLPLCPFSSLCTFVWIIHLLIKCILNHSLQPASFCVQTIKQLFTITALYSTTVIEGFKISFVVVFMLLNPEQKLYEHMCTFASPAACWHVSECPYTAGFSKTALTAQRAIWSLFFWRQAGEDEWRYTEKRENPVRAPAKLPSDPFLMI